MIWFDRSRAEDLTATLELRVRLRSGGRPVPFALHIERGRLRVRLGRAPEASATATVSVRDLLLLAAGRVGWPTLMARGRLELSGDPFLALRLPTLFRLPASARIR